MSAIFALVRQAVAVGTLVLAVLLVVCAPGSAAAHTGHAAHARAVEPPQAAATPTASVKAAAPAVATETRHAVVLTAAAPAHGDCPMAGARHPLPGDDHQGDGGACCCVGHCTAHVSLAAATPDTPVFGPVASTVGMPGALPDGIAHSPRLRPPQTAG